VLEHLQLDLCFVLLYHSFSRDHSQLAKDSLPYSIMSFSAPTISRHLLLGVRMFRGLKLPRTCRKLVVGASTMAKRGIMPTDAPTRALVLISPLQLHLPLLVEPIMFRLPPSRTMLMGESTMLVWRKPRKLLMLSLVYFSSMILLQLCYLILEHHILSYL
jgi:hypothetical protein